METWGSPALAALASTVLAQAMLPAEAGAATAEPATASAPPDPADPVILAAGGVYGASHAEPDADLPAHPPRSPCKSLNADPYNLRAEELALDDCTLSAEVRRMWTEREMVRSFDGRHFPGTPDGMFETWDGALTCVQVVRVPLLSELGLSALKETLAQTVLTKVVKSQQWLAASHVVPHDFVIFCWLPFAVPEDVSEHAEGLMRRVQTLDPRFSLRLRVPAQAGSLFPAMFACTTRERRRVTESDVSTYTGGDESDEDEAPSWDITWGWDRDWEPSEAANDGQSCSSDETRDVAEVRWLESNNGEDAEFTVGGMDDRHVYRGARQSAAWDDWG